MEQLILFQIPELEVVTLALVKLFLLGAALLYVIFAILVTRQISLMKQTLETSLSGLVTLLGLLHLLVALIVLLLFVILL